MKTKFKILIALAFVLWSQMAFPAQQCRLKCPKGCMPTKPKIAMSTKPLAKKKVKLAKLYASKPARSFKPRKTQFSSVKPIEKKKSEETMKISVHGGRATYLKDKIHEKYLVTGLSIEQGLSFAPYVLIPGFSFVIGSELNQYTNGKQGDLYDVTFKAGPKMQAKLFEIDLQGLSSVAFNKKGDSTVEGGAQAKLGVDFGATSVNFFMARTQSFSKFGVGFGISF